jgi:hypothetical protein
MSQIFTNLVILPFYLFESYFTKGKKNSKKSQSGKHTNTIVLKPLNHLFNFSISKITSKIPFKGILTQPGR